MVSLFLLLPSSIIISATTMNQGDRRHQQQRPPPQWGHGNGQQRPRSAWGNASTTASQRPQSVWTSPPSEAQADKKRKAVKAELDDLTKSLKKRIVHAIDKKAALAKIGLAILNGSDDELAVGQEWKAAGQNCLKTLEKHERLQILELAAWKYMCQRDFPEEYTSASQAMSWMTDKWRKFTTRKQSFFRCNEVVVIMDSVAPWIKD